MLNILIFFYMLCNAILPVKVFTCRVKLWQKMVCRFDFAETVCPLFIKRNQPYMIKYNQYKYTTVQKFEFSMGFFFF